MPEIQKSESPAFLYHKKVRPMIQKTLREDAHYTLRKMAAVADAGADPTERGLSFTKFPVDQCRISHKIET